MVKRVSPSTQAVNSSYLTRGFLNKQSTKVYEFLIYKCLKRLLVVYLSKCMLHALVCTTINNTCKGVVI